jgi:quercetin dioxygenase-like cupin family protein
MPAINKPIVLSSGDSMELLETSAMTSGAYVKARLVFKRDGPRFPSHIHPYQDETYEVVSGVLIYMLDGVKHTGCGWDNCSLAPQYGPSPLRRAA